MAVEKPNFTLAQPFSDLEEPRVTGRTLYPMHVLIVLALTAIMAGCRSWTDVADFCAARQSWLTTFLDLPHGTPSHDTFSRFFALLDAKKFAVCFARWAQGVAEALREQLPPGTVIPIDGKCLRGSFDRAAGRAPIHLVGAWSSHLRLALGHLAVGDKSNEIKAIPELLELLHLRGCIVTIDAMGTQKEIAAQLVDRGADYYLALKGNHPTMNEEVRLAFEEADTRGWEDQPDTVAETVEKGHGRIELRRCCVMHDIEWFEDRGAWKGLQCFVRIEAERIVGEQRSTEQRYYLGSSTKADAREALAAIRSHWGIENELHHVLDVDFGEDASRIRKDHGPENATTLRRMALNVLRATGGKLSVTKKQKRCAWDGGYHLQALAGIAAVT